MQAFDYKSLMNLYHTYIPIKQPMNPKTLLHSPKTPPPNNLLPIQKNRLENKKISVYITNFEFISIYY